MIRFEYRRRRHRVRQRRRAATRIRRDGARHEPGCLGARRADEWAGRGGCFGDGANFALARVEGTFLFISIRGIRMTSHRVFKQGRGRVVIFSVHQPSPRAFRAIDRVMLLGPGGKRLWCGAPRDAEGFFTAAGLPCPEENLFNLGASSSTPEPSGADAGLHADALVASLTLPDRGYRVDVSEWMLEVASCPARVAALAAARVDCAELPRTSAPSSPSSGTPPVPPLDAHSTVASPSRHRSWITETRVLLGRAGKTVARDPTLLVAHLLVALVTAAVLGWLYLNSPKSLAGFQNRAGGMFFTLVFFGLASLSAADRLAAESAVRAREIQSGYHGAGQFLFILVRTIELTVCFVYRVVRGQRVGDGCPVPSGKFLYISVWASRVTTCFVNRFPLLLHTQPCFISSWV